MEVRNTLGFFYSKVTDWKYDSRELLMKGRGNKLEIKVLLLDLDGTVREPISYGNFINNPTDQRLIDGVEEALSRYKDWKIIGITNQGGVAAGFKTFEDCVEEQRYTLELVPAMSMICFCTDSGESFYRLVRFKRKIMRTPTQNKSSHKHGLYRKPEPGMLNFAKNYYGKPAEVLMVGDRPEDEGAAIAADVPFMWAEKWRDG